MKFDIFSVCDRGNVRSDNQDSILVYTDEKQALGIFLVADGMGGYANGAWASQTIKAAVQDWISTCLSGQADQMEERLLLQSLCGCLETVNRKVYREGEEKGMCGSTCALLLIYKSIFAVISAGDSRVYRIGRWSCRQISTDDVWENQAQVRNNYPARDIEKHANYGKLTQAVGIRENIGYSVHSAPLRKKEVFALCSDGVYKMCEKKYLTAQLGRCRRGDLRGPGQELIGEVYRNGARDNLSLIVVKCRK